MLESLVCIALVLGLFLLRSRITDIPLFVGTSLVTACLWLSAVQGSFVSVCGIDVLHASAVFFSALLVSLLVTYVQEGPPAGRMMLFVIIGSSVLIHVFLGLARMHLLQLGHLELAAELDFSIMSLLASIVVLVLDFVILTTTYGLLQQKVAGLHLLLRIYGVLCIVQVLDGALYQLFTNITDPQLGQILTGIAYTRLLIAALCAPIVYFTLKLDTRIRGRLEAEQLPLLGLFSLSNLRLSRQGRQLEEQVQALQENERQFRELVESVHGVTWEMDSESWKYTYMGPQIEALTGHAPQLWTDVDFWSAVLHPDDRERAVAFSRRQTELGNDHIHEYRLLCADGEVIWLRDSVVVVRDAEGRTRRRGVLLDITDQKLAQQRLQQSEQRYRTIVEFAVEGLMILDASAARYVHVNHKAELLFRRSREQLMDSGPLSLSPELQPDGTPSGVLLRRHMDAALGGQPQEFEWMHLDSTGRGFPCEVRMVLIPGQEQPLLRASVIDISERKQAEQELADSRRREQEMASRFRMAADSARIGIWDYDLVEHRLVWDGRMHEIYGVPVKDFRGRIEDWSRRLHPDDLELTQARLQAAREGREKYETSFRIIKPDGELRYINSVATVLWDEQGRALRMIGLNFDVTERELAEAELRRAKEMQSKAGEVANVGGWEFDMETQRLEWSPQTKLLHEVPEDYQPDINTAFDFFSGDSRDELLEAVRRAVESGEPYDLELDFLSARGRQARVRTVGQVEFRNGEAVRLWGAIQDITDQHMAEQDRLQLQQQMLHAQKLESLGVLSGGIAHDFNNLLTSILGNAELAAEDLEGNAEAGESIREIQLAAQRAASLSRQMLAYSGRGRFVIESISINEVVAEMAHLLEVSISKKARLEYELAAGLVQVEADPAQIRQVIMNLITNASESLEDNPGSIVLHTGSMQIADPEELVRDEQCAVFSMEDISPGQYIFFEVRDTGCGMSAETASRIFDPFFSTKFTGRGLGLAATLGIVRGHSGAIRICSSPGQGTAVRVLLPVSAVNAVAEQQSSRSELRKWKGSGLVLIADDDELVLTVGTRMLRNFGFEVATACDGRQAVQEFSRRPDAFVMAMLDLTMPNLGGDEALREIRKLRPDLRVLVCSGYDELEVGRELGGVGLVSFVQKPYVADDLRGAIRRLLESDAESVLWPARQLDG
ncbi:MAG: PAS domain-containing protein [bacterium]